MATLCAVICTAPSHASPIISAPADIGDVGTISPEGITMLNRVTISTLLKTVIMTLGIAVIVMLSLTAWDSWNRLASANQAEAAANAEGHLFTALYNMRIDRATTGIDLNSDRTGVSQVLGKSRAAEMAALQSALEYLPQVDFPDQPAMTTELADRFKRIQESHDETAAALAQPKASRPAGLAES